MARKQSTFTRRQLLTAAAGAALLGACADAPGQSTGESPTSVGDTSSAAATALPTTSTTAASPSTKTAASSTTTAVQNGAPAQFLRSGPIGKSQAALTFHGAGDAELTRRMVAMLAPAKVPITIFAVGSWLEDNPGIATLLLDAGHELGNHTYSHLSLGELGAADVAAEIRNCRDVLTAQTGRPGRWFRPSAIEVPTDLIRREAGAAGYAVSVGYDVDSLDYLDPGAAAIVLNVAAAVTDGSIVSLHLGHPQTIAAMPGVLNVLQTRQLRPVTVSTLLG